MLKFDGVYYAGKNDLFSEEEISFYDRLEKEWEDSQPRLRRLELLNIFPQAKTYVRKKAKEQIKKLKAELTNLLEIRRKEQNHIAEDPKNKELYEHWTRQTEKLITETERKLRREMFYAMSSPNPARVKAGISDADIVLARERPIEEFYDDKLRKNGRELAGRCEFHEDNTPSFSINTEKNLWHCFSCVAGGDVISYVMKKYGLEFRDAVKRILNL